MTRFAFKTPLQFLALFGMRWRRRMIRGFARFGHRGQQKTFHMAQKRKKGLNRFSHSIGLGNFSTMMATLGMNIIYEWDAD